MGLWTNEQGELTTTLNIVFSVTLYLELCIAITIYCMSHFFPQKVKLSCLNIIEH